LIGGHTPHIENGQRVSRHSLPTLCYLFFPHPNFLKTNAKQSRAPLENKLNKREILASPQVAQLVPIIRDLALPTRKATLQQMQSIHEYL
jgi:hypothetical protein